MTTEWFYTTNKQQMGPVSWNELRELAEVGILKPHDMVWSDGMDEWVKAINQRGLFADRDGAEAVSAGKTSKKSSYAEAKPPPGRRSRPRAEDEVEDEEDAREARKRARKSAEDRTKMAMGVKIGLILGGVALGLLLLVGCGGGLIWISVKGRENPQPVVNNQPPNVNNPPPKENPPPKDNNPPPKDNNPPPKGGAPRITPYTVTNLNQGTNHDKRFNLQKGHVIITVTNNTQFPNTDVDLYIFRGNQPNAFISDIRVPAEDRNCRVEFDVFANESYMIRVVNLGPGRANSCIVRIEER